MARILVVDDEEDVLTVVAQLLRAGGHDVVTAMDGVKIARESEAEPFEVIITDMVMPTRDGIETILAIRRELPDTGIIAMSGGARGSPLYLAMAARLGAHRTLAKPFTPDQLNTAIAETLALIAAGRKKPD
jgi:CheY-like chemotaxis protein